VAYGTSNCFFYANFTNSVSCSNGLFGDPIVGSGKSCYYKIITPPPSANFDAWGLSGTAPYTTAMHIVDTSNITSCSWNYGDGQTGTSCVSLHNHTYTSAGSYTVSLTVSGPGGTNSFSRPNYINVSDPLPAACPTINNWMGEYWANQTLSGPRVLCRDDADINFDWAYGSPDPALPSDGFSVRWTRTLGFVGGYYR
jgi:PKD repeat protein